MLKVTQPISDLLNVPQPGIECRESDHRLWALERGREGFPEGPGAGLVGIGESHPVLLSLAPPGKKELNLGALI